MSSEQSRHLAHLALNVVAEAVRSHEPSTVVMLPPRPTLEEVMSACARSVNVQERVTIPPLPTASTRDRLRRLALENMPKDIDSGSSETMIPTPDILSMPREMPIRIKGLLQTAPIPRPATVEQRRTLKKRFFGDASFGGPAAEFEPTKDSHGGGDKENQRPSNARKYPRPYHVTIVSRLDMGSKLPTILANLCLTAIDCNNDQPVQNLRNVPCLWDTGAETAFISDDLLGPVFYAHLSDDIHNPYRDEARTRVQVSCAVEFSNSLAWIHTIATVLPRAMVPNGRSGVILGQAGFLDSIQYESVPRAILVAKNHQVPEGVWGDINISAYLQDEELREV